jgi:hypothetical protein
MSIHNIQDTQAPFMLLQASTRVLPWEEGVLLAYRLQTTAMQLSASTLQLYTSEDLHFSAKWHAFTCAPTAAALCRSDDTGVALMGTQPVTTPRDVHDLLARSALLRDFDGLVCTSGSSGRSAGDTDVYTVSMCDLVEGALRFVVQDTDAGTLVYWTRDTTGIAESIVVSVIALYAATNLAQNTSSLIAGDVAGGGVSQTLNVLVCVVCVAVLTALCETHRGYYVSKQDVLLYIALLVFLAADVVLLLLKAMGTRDERRNFGHQIGISTVMILLGTLRLHNTFSTPFMPVLFGIFGTRTACKVLQQIRESFVLRSSAVNLVSVLLDLCVWCSLLAYNLMQCREVHEQLAVATNMTLALLLGLGMSVLIAERKT